MSEYSELPHVLQLLKEAALQQDGSPRKGYASSSPMVGYGETDIWAPRCSCQDLDQRQRHC